MTMSTPRLLWACLPLALGACAITPPPAQVPARAGMTATEPIGCGA